DHEHDDHEHDDHGHDDHGHDDHEHDHGLGLRSLLAGITGHRHEAAASIDSALEASDRGVRALKISLAGLGLTAAAQLVVALASGSVALLNDTFHNAADALTALPLWLAFSIGRRPSNTRYPYGYGRAEDLAGVVVVLMIAASALIAAHEAVQALVDPDEVRHLWAVVVASLAGFAGNEAVARYRIRVGREIGSAALVADGLHARTDGFSSLGVLAGAAGVAAGWDRADAVAGLGIALMIVMVLRQAASDVLARLMDAVDPALAGRTRSVLAGVDGVEGIGEVRIRWIGHRLHAEAEVVVDADLNLVAAHRIAEDARHALLHQVPRLASALIHADPCDHHGTDHHAALEHHQRRPGGSA
ncbi:MAG TPA: cation diffusion facilitator family transporter, partial [Acidimicrobiia bacterium]|nr:cation diffusion facilitator family transporter [Acidimicrobiia bacterium]